MARRGLLLAAAVATAGMLSGCDFAKCGSGETECGTGCMPTGNSCCPDGQHNCNQGSTCNASNLCVVGSGTTGTTSGTGGTGGTASGSMGACGTCSGQLQCSQWISGQACNWQSCACYFTLNGSDTMKEFYHASDGQCFQCSTTNTTCTSAAQALINHCYGL